MGGGGLRRAAYTGTERSETRDVTCPTVCSFFPIAADWKDTPGLPMEHWDGDNIL